jgi:hypothetical protein
LYLNPAGEGFGSEPGWKQPDSSFGSNVIQGIAEIGENAGIKLFSSGEQQLLQSAKFRHGLGLAPRYVLGPFLA